MMKGVPQHKDIGGCSIAGIMSEAGVRFGPDMIMRAIGNMRRRSNGLGGGFAAYGIYPQYRDLYALHVMFDDDAAKQDAERVLAGLFDVHHQEPIPVRHLDSIKSRPILHRYFAAVKQEELERNYDRTEQDMVVESVIDLNANLRGAFVFSSGKNMGVFKGLGYPEEIGDFFRLEDYEGYLWTAHGRFPTNTTGWWGGAHPFALLDWSVVHNGEISSYGINRRYLANFGYDCAFQTDTEVITYLFHLLVRKHGLPLQAACTALAPPFWSQIRRMPPEQRKLSEIIRITYGGALLNGPFSVLVGHSGGMLGFNDRIKLRPMVAARKGDMLFVASEEAAVREVCPDPERLWRPRGGEPVVGELRRQPAAVGAGGA